MKSILTILVCALLLVGCGGKRMKKTEVGQAIEKIENVVVGEHNARNSLSYLGVYEGIVPFAENESVKIRVTLNRDSTYKYEREHLMAEKSSTNITATGNYVWNLAGNEITLVGLEGKAPNRFFVTETRLITLNDNGTRMEGEKAERHTLHQTEVFMR